MTSERDPVLMEKAKAAWEVWWNGNEPHTKSTPSEMLHDFAQEEQWRAIERAAHACELEAERYERECMQESEDAALSCAHAIRTLSQAGTNTKGCNDVQGTAREDHPLSQVDRAPTPSPAQATGDVAGTPAQAVHQVAASPAAELLREVVDGYSSLLNDISGQRIGHAPEQVYSGGLFRVDDIKARLERLTAAREHLDNAETEDASTASTAHRTPEVADPVSALATDPTFRQCCSPGSEYRAARRAVAVLESSRRAAPGVGLCECGHEIGEHSRSKGPCGLCPCSEYEARPTPEAPRSTEAVELSTDALERIIERISYSPCDGDDLLTFEARGELDELLAACRTSRPARSMATEGAPCAQHKWESKRRGGSPSDESSDERVIVCRECGMEWNGEDDPTAAELSQQEIDTLVTATVARGRDEPQRAPFPGIFAIMYPRLVAVARAHGYALAVHGSMARDLDLIAVPWVKKCADPQKLIEALYGRVGSVHLEGPASKPHGRLGWCIHLGGGPYIDVSVCPPTSHVAGGGETFTAEEQRNAHENFEAWNALTNMLIEEGIEFGDEEGGPMACARNIVHGIKRRLAEATPPASASSAVGERLHEILDPLAPLHDAAPAWYHAENLLPDELRAARLKFRIALEAAYPQIVEALSATCGEAGELPRVETGVVQFEDDWPGVFIRGDNAGYYAQMLRHALGMAPMTIGVAALSGLAELLESSSTLRGGSERAQKLTRAPSREGEKP